MRRQICKLGAVLGLSPLAFGLLTTASASAATKPAAPKTKSVTATCKVNTSIAVAAGDSAVLPPVTAGSDFGQTHCGAVLGGGVEFDTFTVPSNGDTLAKYTLYFGQGTIHGNYDLTPVDSQTLNFLQASWTGTLTVGGGTGAYRGVTGTGKLTCSTSDGIHTSCTENLKLKVKVS